ncbi:MAG: hypothetical protein ABFS41_06890 [Myxococcota bacterium]
MSQLARGLRVLAICALAWLSVPGVEAARAEGDLLPPVDELFAWNARPERRVEAPTVSCSPNAGAVGSPEREARRQAALAQLSALLQAQPGGDFEVLNNRGYAYPSMRDPRQEMLMVEMEARRQRRAAAKRRAEN